MDGGSPVGPWKSVFDFEYYPGASYKIAPLGDDGRWAGCRFCGRRRPAVTFKRLSHVIPKFLGNRWLFSRDECDQCNEMFGHELEQELSDLLAPTLVLSACRGLGTRKKFRGPYDRSFMEKDIESRTLTVSVFSDDPAPAVRCVMDEARGVATFSTSTKGIQLARIARAIGRLGLFCLDRKELDRQRYLADWVRGDLAIFPLVLGWQKVHGLRSIAELRLEVQRSRLLGHAPYCVILVTPHLVFYQYLPIGPCGTTELDLMPPPRLYTDPASRREFDLEMYSVGGLAEVRLVHEVSVPRRP